MGDQPKWTPGPWAASVVYGWGDDPVVRASGWTSPIAMMIPHKDRYYRHVRREIRGETVVSFGPETPEGEARKAEVDAELLANAHLIATAPEAIEFVDLLAALPIEPVADDVPLFGLNGVYITHGTIRRAREVAAKARGQA